MFPRHCRDWLSASGLEDEAVGEAGVSGVGAAMTGVRILGVAMACALAAAAATPVLALPKPRYPVDGAETAHKGKHDAKKPDLAGGPKTYVVAHGDTLTSIARKLGVTQKALAEANDLHGASVKPGTKLHVPRPSAKDKADREEAADETSSHGRKGAAAKSHAETYTVAHGDTLASVARKLGVSSRELADANDLHGKPLRSGMKLQVPSGALREAETDEHPAHGKHASEAPSTYTVAHGDTLAGVAKKLHVSAKALADANDLHGKPLRFGMKLKVPGGGAPVEVASEDRPTRGKHADAAEAAPTSYTVVHGDTLYSVARRLHVTQQALVDANDLRGKPLRSGMKLKVPGSAAPVETARADRTPAQSAPGGGTYTVAKGDTQAAVAKRFHINPRELRAANDLAPDEPLDRGMKLKLPSDAHDHGRDAHASGALIAPKVQVAAAKPFRTPPPPDDSAAPPVEVAAATAPPARVVTPPPATHPIVGGPPVARSTVPLPTPRPSQTGELSGDTEGPPPMPGSPTFRAANDHAAVTSIHPPVTKGFPSSAELASLGKGRFIWPVRGEIVTRFGDMGHDLKNDGLNISADLGSTVRSAADGQVVYAGNSVPGFGNMVLVKHADGWLTAYGHLARIDVKISQKVLQGDQIGQVGDSGGVDRPQLHFEVRYAPPSSREKARAVDPSILLP